MSVISPNLKLQTMMKFLLILAALCVLAQAETVDELKKKLDEYKNILDDIRVEQLSRGIDVIVSKKGLAKDDDAVKCVKLEGNKYLQKLVNNNEDFTKEMYKKLQGYQDQLNDGKTDEVEAALKDTLPKEVETVLTNWQAKGEVITLEYVRVANKCIGI